MMATKDVYKYTFLTRMIWKWNLLPQEVNIVTAPKWMPSNSSPQTHLMTLLRTCMYMLCFVYSLFLVMLL
jgi:hypothetical protein